jgi:hypothetical protein
MNHRYRTGRGQWHAWLDARDQAHDAVAQAALDRSTPIEHPDADRTFWEAAMANPPPGDIDADAEHHASEMVADQLGGRVMRCTPCSSPTLV